MPLKDQLANAVICAQAFHWFATREALAEIHRVLAPGGLLGLIWNVRDESVDWVAAITAIITPYEGDAPRFHTGAWRRVIDGKLFSAMHETRFAHQHVGGAQEVIIDRFLSVSFIAALSAAEKARVADKLKALIATHPHLRDRPVIAFPYQTRAYWCTRAAKCWISSSRRSLISRRSRPRWRCCGVGDLRIELFEVPEATPMSPDRRIPDRDVHTHGNKHVAFAIRDVEPVERELRARGADIVWVSRFKHGSNIFIRDNAGNLIELAQEPGMWEG